MRSAGIVVWREVAAALACEIAQGTPPPGGRLPAEAVLARRFGVNRHTLRRAVASLEAQGLLSVQHGRGTFVQPRLPLRYRLGARTRFGAIMAAQGRRAEAVLLSAGTAAASPAQAKGLGLPEGCALLALEILRSADGVPLSLSTTWLEAARFAGIGEAVARTGSLSAALAGFRVADYVRRTTRVWARLPSASEALALQQGTFAPVLVIESLDQDLAGRPLQLNLARTAGERVQLVVDGEDEAAAR